MRFRSTQHILEPVFSECTQPKPITKGMRSSILQGLCAAGLICSCIRPVLAKPYPAPAPAPAPANRRFDYVIVGAGPGGLVMANRLSENPRVSVAVIEAGTWAEDVIGNRSEVPAYDNSFLVTSLNATPSAVDWAFTTAPQGVSSSCRPWHSGRSPWKDKSLTRLTRA